MTDQPEPDRYQEHLDAFGASLRKASLEHRALRPAVSRRPLLVVAGLVVAIAAVVGIAVDRGQPGTFVGEAGAREVLRAAADATRGDEMPAGWQWAQTTTVERRTLEGKRCKSCPTERAVFEQSFTEDVWIGERGEAYRFGSGGTPRAVENEPLMRATGMLDMPPARRPDEGMHVPPARNKRDAAALGMPGWVDDPVAVPSEPNRIAQWARTRVTAQARAWRRQAREGRGRMSSSQSQDERVASTLVDLATSAQLSGPQKAAAFEALASLAAVTVDAVPSTFADPQRVAVRVAGGRSRKTHPLPRPDRIIVFDRTSFRVVAEQMEDRSGSARATVVFVGPKKTAGRMRMIGGVSGERRYAAPVSVAGPGLDGDGRRLFDVSAPREMGRDGQPRPQPKTVSKIR